MAESAFPPDPSFSGIDFNPSFFPSTASDYVEIPVAQGTETFSKIFLTEADTPTPSVDFNLLNSQTANINIGAGQQTGALNLGGSVRTTGGINIGTTSVGVTPIVIEIGRAHV